MRALNWCDVPSGKCAGICVTAGVRPVHASVRTFYVVSVVLRKAVVHTLYALGLVYLYCLCTAHARVLCRTACTQILFVHLYWDCCYNLIYAYIYIYTPVLLVHPVYDQWYAKCVPREPISRGSASQTADGILRCGPSVSISHFSPVGDLTPRAQLACCQMKVMSKNNEDIRGVRARHCIFTNASEHSLSKIRSLCAKQAKTIDM